jgi:methionyl-tRNA synthetase
MDLEEKTLEKAGDHCEVCGVKLTPQELQTVLESGGPALCTIHATEAEPALESDELDFDA